MLSGNVLLGISLCMILIPNIPEMIEAVKQKQQVNKDDEVTLEKISDLATGNSPLVTSWHCLHYYSD